MNLRAKFVFLIGLLGLVCLMLPGSLRADTVLTYTGNAYTFCQYAYTCTGTSPALSFTLDTTLTGPQFDNLAIGTVTGGNLSGFVSSFALTDGAEVTVTQSTAALQFFDVTTVASGDITSWEILAYTNGTQGAVNYFGATCNGSAANCSNVDTTQVLVNGYYYLAYGQNSGAPGTWTVTTTPEPGTGGLMLLGVGLLGLVMRKRIAPGLLRAT